MLPNSDAVFLRFGERAGVGKHALGLHQAAVDAADGHQFGVGARFGEAALLQRDEPVRAAQGGQAVCDGDLWWGRR